MDTMPGTPISLRILICDDHPLMLRGLKELLEAHENWTICGEVESGRKAVDAAERLRPDIAILDVTVPDLNGLDASKRIKRASPRTKVVIYSIHYSAELARQAVDAGASAYVLKESSDRDLANAVKAVGDNQRFFSPEIMEALLKEPPNAIHEHQQDQLTTREREILQLLAEGKSSKEVAAHLDLSTKTAETHRSNIMRKLNAHKISDLVLFAIRNRMIEA